MSPHGSVESEYTEHTELSTALRELEDLRAAMRTRPAIEQAKGILMAQHHCDADTAFAMLRTASMRENRKLNELAACIVAATIEAGRHADKPCVVGMRNT